MRSLGIFAWLVLWAGTSIASKCVLLSVKECEAEALDCTVAGDKCEDRVRCHSLALAQDCAAANNWCMWDMQQSICVWRDSIRKRDLAEAPTSLPSFTRFPTTSWLKTRVPSVAPSIRPTDSPSTAASEDPRSTSPTQSPLPFNEALKKLLHAHELSPYPCASIDAQCPGNLICFQNTTPWLDPELRQTAPGFCGCSRSLNRLLPSSNTAATSLTCSTIHDSMWVETTVRSFIAIGEFLLASVCIYLMHQRRYADSIFRVLTSAIGHALFWLGMSSAASFSWKVLELLCVHLPEELYKISAEGHKECLYSSAIMGLALASFLMAYAALGNILAEWWYILNALKDRSSFTFTPYVVMSIIFVTLGIAFPQYRYLSLVVFLPPTLVLMLIWYCRPIPYGRQLDDVAARSARRTICRLLFDVLILTAAGCVSALTIVAVTSLSHEEDFWLRPGLWLLILCEFLFFCIKVELTVAAFRIHRHLNRERAADSILVNATSLKSSSAWV